MLESQKSITEDFWRGRGWVGSKVGMSMFARGLVTGLKSEAGMHLAELLACTIYLHC